MRTNELRDKHTPLELSQGKGAAKAYCQGCVGPNNALTIEWPCDVIKVLDAWDFERAMQKIEDISVELDLPE